MTFETRVRPFGRNELVEAGFVNPTVESVATGAETGIVVLYPDRG